MNTYTKTVSASDLKNNTSEILSLVAYGGYDVFVEKYGNEIAKITPIKKVKTKKNYENLLAKYYGSIPDFPEVYKFRNSRKKYVKIFD